MQSSSGYRNFQPGQLGHAQFNQFGPGPVQVTQQGFNPQQHQHQQQFGLGQNFGGGFGTPQQQQQQQQQQGQHQQFGAQLGGGRSLHTPSKRGGEASHHSQTTFQASSLSTMTTPSTYVPSLEDTRRKYAMMDPILWANTGRPFSPPNPPSRDIDPTRSPERYLAYHGHSHIEANRVPPPAMPPSAPAMAANQEAQRMALELAKRRSRKPTDKNIPEGVEECIIGDGVANYKRLREVERKLDASMMRKRMNIQDGRASNMKRFRTLRIWISNTVEDQEWQGGSVTVDAFDFTTRRDASWKVKIEGRLLDEEEEEEDTDSEDEDDGADKMDTDKKKVSESKHRFSHFFKSLTVDFEKSRTHTSDFPEISWKKPIIPPNARTLPPAADFDCLEFKRGGDENQNVVFKLVRDEQPERFKLSPPLRELVDQEEATRAEVVTGVWEYVRIMGLQDEEDRRTFRCDELLKQIFNRDTFSIPFIQEHLASHMQPLPPISLPYTIRVDKAFHESSSTPQPTIYDIQLPLDSTLRLAMQAHLTSPSYAPALQQIAALNDETAVIVAALQHSKAKHNFLENLARDPVGWLGKWVDSQQRDLEIIKGETARTGENVGVGEEWRKGGERGAWGTEGAREAAAIYLHKDATMRGVKDRV